MFPTLGALATAYLVFGFGLLAPKLASLSLSA